MKKGSIPAKTIEAVAAGKPVTFNAKVPDYRTLAYQLIESQPSEQKAHYRKKVSQFIRWWRKKLVSTEHLCGRVIPDVADSKLESSKKAPSWRRIARCVAKGDRFCTLLGFSAPKSALMAK